MHTKTPRMTTWITTETFKSPTKHSLALSRSLFKVALFILLEPIEWMVQIFYFSVKFPMFNARHSRGQSNPTQKSHRIEHCGPFAVLRCVAIRNSHRHKDIDLHNAESAWSCLGSICTPYFYVSYATWVEKKGKFHSMFDFSIYINK